MDNLFQVICQFLEVDTTYPHSHGIIDKAFSLQIWGLGIGIALESLNFS